MAIAHVIEKNAREAYSAEVAMEDAKGGGKKKMNPADMIFKRWSGET